MSEEQRRLDRSNIKVDFKSIARGIYEMMPEEYKAAMVYGMCPAPFMQMAEKHFKENIVMASIKRSGEPATKKSIDTYMRILDKSLVKAFNHLLALAMLAEAKSRGALAV